MTEEKTYIDGYLKQNLDFCIQRLKKDWDCLAIIDGDEGTGKSVFSWSMCGYIAEAMGKTFTLDNIYFDPQELMKKATSSYGEVLCWDEAALEGLSANWQNKIQQELVKTLMVARSRNHFWVFIIPSVFRLNRYISMDRGFFLVNVYSPDNLHRGLFRVYGKNKKNLLLEIYQSSKKKRYDKLKDFYGRFTKSAGTKYIDSEAYDKKKDIAIHRYFTGMDKKESKDVALINDLKTRILKLPKRLGITLTYLSEQMDYHRNTLHRWDNEAKNATATRTSYIKQRNNVVDKGGVVE